MKFPLFGSTHLHLISFCIPRSTGRAHRYGMIRELASCKRLSGVVHCEEAVSLTNTESWARIQTYGARGSASLSNFPTDSQAHASENNCTVVKVRALEFESQFYHLTVESLWAKLLTFSIHLSPPKLTVPTLYSCDEQTRPSHQVFNSVWHVVRALQI